MFSIINITSALLPPLYCGAVGLYALAFFRREERFQNLQRPALLIVLAVHTLLIYAETAYFGHCLVYSPFELLTLVAFMVTFAYLIVELSTGEKGTGVFFLAVALLLQTLSQMFSPSTESGLSSPILLEDVVGLHITAAIFGYTAFTISAIYGILYLMLYHRIRSNKFGLFYERLPSLGLLEKMSANATIFGLIFLTIAILIAVLWLPNALPGFSYGDPKVIGTGVVWGLYAIAIAVKFMANVDQRRFILLSLVGFGSIVFSMTVINLLLSRFHNFQ